jgi:hypothetical protein
MATNSRFIATLLVLAIAIPCIHGSAIESSALQPPGNPPNMSSATPSSSIQDIITELQIAIDGLLFSSESDFPFEIISWSATELPVLTSATLLAHTGHKPATAVSTATLENLFAPLITEQDWHTEDDKTTLARFRQLLEKLQKHLHDIQVYRVGEIELDIYILGKTASGEWLGLSTKAVET